MKIFYISQTSFFQVDSTVLHEWSKEHEVHYALLIPQKNANYSLQEVNTYCTENHIVLHEFQLKYRLRDFRLITTFWKIINLVKQAKPDVIYLAGIDHPIFSLLTALLPKNKTIIGFHDVDYHSNFNNTSFYKVGRTITLKIFKNYQVFSENQKKIFSKKYPNKHVTCIPLALSSYGEIPRTKALPDPKFLFFGNILEYKGLDLLIEAFKIVVSKNPEVELIIAGRCSNWEEKYAGLVANCPNVTINLKFIANDEVAALFSSARYLVLPYKDATQSGPLMIAYNYQIPVIASDVEAFTESVSDGKSGFLFKSNEVNSLVEVMNKAIGLSENDYVLLQENLKTFVENKYSTKAIAAQYIDMFKNLSK
ncbi:MAG: glycosyltransferase family 4 protein [Cytophagales bacterium]